MKKIEDINKSYFGPRVSDGAGVFVAGFVFLYIFQVVLLLIAYLTGVDINNLETLPIWFSWVMLFINQVALVLAVAAYSGIARKPLLRECRIERKLNYKQILILPVIAIFGILAFLPLAQGFVQLVTLITKETPSVGISIGTKWWEVLVSIIFVCVFPAIGEEILFRGCVARSLKRKNYLFAILVSGFMFSIFHGNAAQTVHQFFIGLVFAYLYFVTGSLLASIICHFSNNALAVLFDVILVNVDVQISNGALISIYVVMSIVGFVGLYFLLRYIMKLSKQAKGIENTTDKMAWAKDLGKAFTAQGIKDNYNRLENSLKSLFDDPCDGINLNGDIQIENDNLQADSFATGNQDNQLDKLLTEANKQTIKKRKKFDLYSLIAAIGIALAVWIINLL